MGLGRIGMEVAKRANGFDMGVPYYARHRRPEAEPVFEVVYVEGLWQLRPEVAFVTLHVPLTPDTHHLMGEVEPTAMKSTAFLINISRGGILDQEMLTRVLERGVIASAGLYMATPESIPVDHALFKLSTVVLTSHIGSAPHEAQR